MIRAHTAFRASQNRKHPALGLLTAGLLALFFTGCSGSDPGPGRMEDTECRGMVRATLEKVDRTPSAEQRETVILEAIDGLGIPPPARCERDLLMELLEIHEVAATPDKLIRTAERLIALGSALSPDQRARVKLKLAEAYFKIGSPRSFDLAKDVFLQWDSMGVRSMKMFQATSLLVLTYDLTGELEECMILLQGALDKARKQDDPLWTGELLDRLGSLLVRQGKPGDAIAIQHEGLALLNKFLHRGAIRDTLLHRKDAHHPDSTRKVAASGGASMAGQDSTPRLLTIRDQLMLRQRLRYHLGEAYLAIGRLDSAKAAFLDAVTIATGPLGGEVEAPFVELGQLELTDGAANEAIAWGNRGLAHARSAKDPAAIQRSADLLYLAYKKHGDVVKALAMHELARAYGDSLGDASFSMGLLKKQVLYEVRDDSLRMVGALSREQLERVNAQLEARSNRTIAVAVGGIGVFLLGGAGFWFRMDRRRRMERFERESAQLETQALRSQMNPHFIFNALNSINDFVQRNDQDSASFYLIKFARVMRAVLENSRHSEVPLGEDIDALRGYMELERMRMHEKFDFGIEVASDIDPEQVMVPPLVVQPFVENAIWHGMSGKEGRGNITLKVEQRGTQLVWIIEDDGVGRNALKASETDEQHALKADSGKKTSLGTAITRARLDLVQRQHGGTAGFRYFDLPKGTRVQVELPLIME